MGLSPASLASGIGALLGRTVFVQTNTATGIPAPLLVLDIVEEEVVSYEATVTEHPVEQGPEITDHIQLKNPTIRIKGKISNTPLDLSVAIANVAAGGLAAISSAQARSNLLNTGLSQSAGLVGASLQGKAANPLASGIAGAVDAICRTILITCYENRTPFTLITKRQTFPNVVIQNLTLPRNKETGFALAFELEIKQIKIVRPIQVQKTSVSENTISSAVPSTSLGAQSTQAVSPQISDNVKASNLDATAGVSGKSPSFFGVA